MLRVEIFLALSDFFPDAIEPIRSDFNELLGQEHIRVWHSPYTACDPKKIWHTEVADRIHDAFLVSLRPDLIFIPGIFPGSVAYFSYPGLLTSDIRTVAIVEGLDHCQSHQIAFLKIADLLLVKPPHVSALHDLGISDKHIKSDLFIGETEFSQQDAQALLRIFVELVNDVKPTPARLDHRPKLAYVSPLPPDRSGIADYSAQLLPYLARYYDIDLIIDQPTLSKPNGIPHCAIKTCDWFLQNAHLYDRVIYHFGNSPFHQHMFVMLARVPGIVVLHDFYLGDIQHFLENSAGLPHAHTRAIYLSHGYDALIECFQTKNLPGVIRKYPANLEVLQQASHIIVHSQHSRSLADAWYGSGFSDNWTVVPLLRAAMAVTNRSMARKKLGLKPRDFIICSFGLMNESKLNHRLLNAWLNSRLATDVNCMLVFVGEEENGEYGAQIRQTIRTASQAKNISITGWADSATFNNYLAAADIAIQLRAFSRGETSAAVLDCMRYALPAIVNVHGSFSELPSDAVWKIPDNFEDNQLIDAMETLWQNPDKITSLGQRAQAIVSTLHAPDVCAAQYAEVIEQTHARARFEIDSLASNISPHFLLEDKELINIASSIARTLIPKMAKKQLFIDVSATCRNDLKTGIQRVVRALVWELILSAPPGYRVEPVYLTSESGQWQYRYARAWTSTSLNICAGWMPDEPVEYTAGDVMLVADFTSVFSVEAERGGVFRSLNNEGVKLHFFVYDLLPILMPEFFPPGQFGFSEWLNTLSRVADSAICISQSVAEDLGAWMKIANPPRIRPMHIDWFHLGANIENSIPTLGIPANSAMIYSRLHAAPSFLMVGTIEPRKGYLQTLEAFTQLWREGFDINLVIVGREGWHGFPDSSRRTIPEIMVRLRNHPELGKRLFWLEGISDEYLEKIYAASTCLIAASEGEGFGLPLIEAAQRGLPIIARDIPVFREVADDHASYFAGLEPEKLSIAVKAWLTHHKLHPGPPSLMPSWLTWKQSVEQLVHKLGLTH